VQPKYLLTPPFLQNGLAIIKSGGMLSNCMAICTLSLIYNPKGRKVTELLTFVSFKRTKWNNFLTV
jgi:hypothetical protein